MSKSGAFLLSMVAATLGFVNAQAAEVILLIDEELEALPAGYSLSEFASANATAEIQVGDIGGSNGLIFDASWNVPASGVEVAIGAMIPVIPTHADFQLYPIDIGGFSEIRWMLDLEVISSTMTPPEQGIFAQLVVHQQQPNGSVLAFADQGNFIQAGESKVLDVVTTETDFGQPGANPDFSANGRPISFGLQFGATYPRVTNPEAFFVDGRMTADNWRVEITRAGIFSDRFESDLLLGQPAEQLSEQEENCICPKPPVINLY